MGTHPSLHMHGTFLLNLETTVILWCKKLIPQPSPSLILVNVIVVLCCILTFPEE